MGSIHKEKNLLSLLTPTDKGGKNSRVASPVSIPSHFNSVYAGFQVALKFLKNPNFFRPP